MAKGFHSTSSVRIRENQRRSRARRKEYIQDLEGRLRRFELLGTQATIEVQAAARKVAEENALLRSFLWLHGVTDAEIESYLHGSTAAPPKLRVHATSPVLATMHLGSTVLSDASKSAKCSEPRPLHNETSRELSREAQPSTPSSTEPSVLPDQPRLETSWPDSRHSGSGDSPQLVPQSTGGVSGSQAMELQNILNVDDATSCETAAIIIANMRGHNDADAARAELGCIPGSTCMVENMTIFQALDD